METESWVLQKHSPFSRSDLSCFLLCHLVLSCLVLSCLVLSCLVLSWLVLSCLALSCLVLLCLVLLCLVLSCLGAEQENDVTRPPDASSCNLAQKRQKADPTRKVLPITTKFSWIFISTSTKVNIQRREAAKDSNCSLNSYILLYLGSTKDRRLDPKQAQRFKNPFQTSLTSPFSF